MQISYEKLVIDENSLFHHQEFIQPRFTSPFHMHDEFELILIIRSNGKLFVGNNVTNFNDGNLFLFSPGLPHCFYNTRGYEKGRKMAQAVVIFFRHDFLGEDFLKRTETIQLAKLLKKAEYGIQIQNPSRALSGRLVRLGEKNDLEKVIEFLQILNELAGRRSIKLLNSQNTLHVSGLSESKIINDVFRYVAENFQKKITLSTAASVANMQNAAFCRYFKRKTKKKFSEFVNETRIMHARKLLAETDEPVKEVAFECGYENSSYFNRQFSRSCKMSPTKFRNFLRQSDFVQN